MSVQITHTVTLTFSSTTKLSELQDFIYAVEQANIVNPVLSVTHYAGDQREPSQTTITAREGK
jgi:hypothetical protein